MEEENSVFTHVLQMINWIKRLTALGFMMDNDLYIDHILQSLPPSYSSFIMNFNMNKIEVSVEELHNMLKTFVDNMKKEKFHLFMIKRFDQKQNGKNVAKAKEKWKEKKPFQSKGGIKKNNSKKHSQAEDKCYHCQQAGH